MIIGVGGKKQHGKSTVTKYLCRSSNYKFCDFSWADPLKEIIGGELLGLTHEEMYGTSEQKEAIVPEWGMSAREILKKIGTDLFRDQFDPYIWVKIGIRHFENFVDVSIDEKISRDYVFSDCRFPNELNALFNLAKEKNIPFASIRVVREDYESNDKHSSENSLDDYPFDYTITAKGGDFESIYEQLERIMSAIRNK